MDPRLVLFDIDGTLVDTAGAGRVALEAAFREVFDTGPVADRTGDVAYAGRTDPTIVRALGEALRIDSDRLEARLDRLEQSYLSLLELELARPEPRRRVLPGVRERLDDLTPLSHVHLGLLTGNTEGGARRKLGAFALNRYFPGGGFGSDAEDRRQVAQTAHRRMCAIAGIRFLPGQVVVVGDTELDVDCARANGFRAIAVRTGWSPPGALESAKPDALFDDLTDGPAFLSALGC